VEAERAVFSATGVDVWLRIRSNDPGAKVAGVLPSDAELAGSAGLSAAVRGDGGTVLRFPPAAWPRAGLTAPLVVRAVRLFSAEGNEVRTDGTWQLGIQLPQGAEAERARVLRTLPPVVKAVAGNDLVVETLKTASATIVRYQLPANVSSYAPPRLRSGARTLEATQSRQEQGPPGRQEVWFEATPDNAPLTVVFDRLAAADPASKPWTVKVALAPFQPPGTTADQVTERTLAWEGQADSTGPILKGILWRRLPDRTELEVTISGLWDPVAGGMPTVLADGVKLRVGGAGTFPATGERGDVTRIAADLASEAAPRNLVVVGGGGQTTMLPPFEITLQE